MRISFRALLLIGAATATMHLQAQRPHDIEIAPTYYAMPSNISGGGSFWQYGAGIDGSARFYRQLGVTAEFAGTHAGDILGNGVNLTMLTYLAGPRYTWNVPAFKTLHSGKLAIFGHALIGGAHGDGVFPAPQGALGSANCFALQLGGGADLRITKRIAVRVVQFDWLRTNFPSVDNRAQENIRLGAGIVFRIRQ
jgi:outer membrane immunogenic protein